MWSSNSSDLVSLLYSVFRWQQPEKNMNTGQIQGYGNWMLFSQYPSLNRFSWSKIWIAHHYGCQQEWNNLSCIYERSLWLIMDCMRPREKTRKPAVRPLRSSRWRMKVAWDWAHFRRDPGVSSDALLHEPWKDHGDLVNWEGSIPWVSTKMKRWWCLFWK